MAIVLDGKPVHINVSKVLLPKLKNVQNLTTHLLSYFICNVHKTQHRLDVYHPSCSVKYVVYLIHAVV